MRGMFRMINTEVEIGIKTMIYGTHNSGTYSDMQGCCMCVVTPWTQNQNLTIAEQLDRGVRWFDLRASFSPIDGEVYLSHTYMTKKTFMSALESFKLFLEQHPRGELIAIHLRVDYADRENASLVQPRVSSMIDYYKDIFLEKSQIVVGWESMRQEKKAILYCSDGTLRHPLIASCELMPYIDFWNAGTIEECERRLSNAEEEFKKQENGPFLFPHQRMFIFDYSTTAPLWFTDWQQRRLMDKYMDTVKKADIVSGNQIEKIMEYFV